MKCKLVSDKTEEEIEEEDAKVYEELVQVPGRGDGTWTLKIAFLFAYEYYRRDSLTSHIQ